MADLWVVLTIVGFFGLCVALVRGCDRIIGPDDAVGSRDEPVEPDSRTTGGGRSPMNGENIAGLVLAVLLALYLVAALIFPERF